MKKLLAIAVAVAVTAPAMADTSVYGRAHVLLESAGTYGSPAVPGYFDNTGTWIAPVPQYATTPVGVLVPGSDDLALSNNGSRLGVKGSNAIDRGLTMTHQIELRGDITGQDNAVTTAYMNVGVKGGFGHVQIGQMDTVMDDVDAGAGFLENGSFATQPADGGNDAQIKYTGAFGPVTALASYRPSGNQLGGTKSQLGLTYKTGPFKLGVATASNTAVTGDLLAKTKVALSYTGANYGVGFVHAQDGAAVKSKSNTLGGKYSFGKAYVAAAYGKEKTGAASTKQTDFELGYNLGKGTKVYYQNKKLSAGGVTTAKSNAIGLKHNF